MAQRFQGEHDTYIAELRGQAVVDDPSLINRDPFGEGWLFKITSSDAPEFLDADAYRALIGE